MKGIDDTATCFSTIQYNTTVKLSIAAALTGFSFSTIQYNTTVKPFV